MSRGPQIDSGHADFATAVSHGDVYGIDPNANQRRRHEL
jgi:hypothetical protein